MTDVAGRIGSGGWDDLAGNSWVTGGWFMLDLTPPVYTVPADFPAALHTALAVLMWAGTPHTESYLTHTEVHSKLESEVVATQSKLGKKASTPTAAGQVLICTASGETEWMDLATAIATYP